MARAQGWNSAMLFIFESTYGTAPGSGYFQIPFISCDLGAEQALLPDDVLGLGRDPQAPTVDLIRVAGSIVVPLDLRNIGFWLKLLLGAPSTSGTGPYTHTFVSGGTSIPSASIEVGLSQVPSYALCKGVKAQSMQIGLSRTGKPVATIQLIGQDETLGTSTVDAAPTTKTLTRFTQAQGSFTKGGSAFSNVLTCDWTFSNGLESIETLRASDALIEGLDLGMASLTGNVNTRFAATTLLTDATAQNALDLQTIWTIDADNKVTFNLQNVYVSRPKRIVNGPGGVEANFPFIGSDDSSEGEMLEVILINDVASY